MHSNSNSNRNNDIYNKYLYINIHLPPSYQTHTLFLTGNIPQPQHLRNTKKRWKCGATNFMLEQQHSVGGDVKKRVRIFLYKCALCATKLHVSIFVVFLGARGLDWTHQVWAGVSEWGVPTRSRKKWHSWVGGKNKSRYVYLLACFLYSLAVVVIFWQIFFFFDDATAKTRKDGWLCR